VVINVIFKKEVREDKWVWWDMPRILALVRLREEDRELKASLRYLTKPFQKNKKNGWEEITSGILFFSYHV
jgi:hypothetical protein